MENDLFLTHALGDPQVDRSQQPQNETRAESEAEVALHVVEETAGGVIVHGAKQLATAAPISNETYVSLSATFVRRADPRFVLAFSIPHGQPGVEDSMPGAGVPSGPAATATRWRPATTSRTRCCSSTTCWCPGTGFSCLYDSAPLLQRLGSEANFRGWGNLCRIHQRMKVMTAVATPHRRSHRRD